MDTQHHALSRLDKSDSLDNGGIQNRTGQWTDPWQVHNTVTKCSAHVSCIWCAPSFFFFDLLLFAGLNN